MRAEVEFGKAVVETNVPEWVHRKAQIPHRRVIGGEARSTPQTKKLSLCYTNCMSLSQLNLLLHSAEHSFCIPLILAIRQVTRSEELPVDYVEYHVK